MGRFWEKDPAPPAEAGQRRSLDLAGPMQHRSTTESRRPASNNGPRRRSVDTGIPAVIAVRGDLPGQLPSSNCSSEGLWGTGRPPLSRRGSNASETLA